MSKQIDNLLDSLIKEIDAKEGNQPEPQETQDPKPASKEAVKRAEAIATGVNQSYRRPPEPVKTSIPAPKIKPVVEPESTSHFTDEPSADPAIRMHDRLDESTLPAPDAERRPNRILGGKKKKQRSIPAPSEAPKRKIPHIQVPDELPPDYANAPVTKPEPEEVDPEREALVRSRAEKIREQLKKHTLEETPIIAPPSEEEINDMLDDLENPEKPEEALTEEDNSIFAYLHQVLGVEETEEAPEASEEAPEADAPAEAARPRWFDDASAPVPVSMHESLDTDDDDEEFDEDEADEDDASLRHLDMEEEPAEKRENPIVRFFRNLFGKRHDDEEEFEDDEFDEEYEDEFDEDDFSEEAGRPADAEDEADFLHEESLPATEVPIPEDEQDYPAPPMPAKREESHAEPEEPETPADTPEELEFDENIRESELDVDLTDDTPEEFDEDETFEDDELEDEEFEEEAAAPARKKHSFFRESLDETAEELAEIKAEPVPQPDEEPGVKNHFLGRNAYFVSGILVFLLALIGLITLITGIVRATGGFFSGGSLRSQLEKTLYPVAVVDVPTFNEPAELTADGALSAAIVDILMYDDLSGYTETFDMISVPAEDVLERGRQMFGVDVQTQLDTLHAAGESFVYDATTNCYNVPTSPMIFSYSPEVKNVKRTGDTYEVTVVYHSDVADWQENSRNFREGSSKTMKATIEKKNSGYRIVSLVSAE